MFFLKCTFLKFYWTYWQKSNSRPKSHLFLVFRDWFLSIYFLFSIPGRPLNLSTPGNKFNSRIFSQRTFGNNSRRTSRILSCNKVSIHSAVPNTFEIFNKPQELSTQKELIFCIFSQYSCQKTQIIFSIPWCQISVAWRIKLIMLFT